MKNRRRIQITCLPSGGRYQIFLLREQISGFFFGPFVLDLSTGLHPPFREIEFFVDSKNQGPKVIGNESGFSHTYASGKLNAYYGFLSKCVEFVESSPDSYPITSAEIKCLQFESLDKKRKPYQPSKLIKYARGGAIPIGELDYAPRTQLYEEAYAGESLVGLCITARDRWLLFSWPTDDPNDESRLTIESTSILFPEDDLSICYKSSLGLYTIGCHQERYIGGIGDMSRNLQLDFEPIYITPAIGTALDYGQYAQYWISRVSPYIYRDLALVSNAHSEPASTEALLDACEGFSLANVNGLTFIQDLVALKETFVPIIRLLKKPFVIKRWADFLLSLKYGARLTWADGAEILRALRNLRKTCHTLRRYYDRKIALTTRYGAFFEEVSLSRLDVECRANARVTAQLAYPDQNLSDWELLDSLLQDLGLRISAENLWDLLPYSFVVDWFIRISDICKRIDFFDFSGRYWLREIVSSQHNSSDTSDEHYLDDADLYGQLHLETYRRWVSVVFPRLSWRSRKGNPFNHMIEGALLLIQKISK